MKKQANKRIKHTAKLDIQGNLAQQLFFTIILRSHISHLILTKLMLDHIPLLLWKEHRTNPVRQSLFWVSG